MKYLNKILKWVDLELNDINTLDSLEKENKQLKYPDFTLLKETVNFFDALKKANYRQTGHFNTSFSQYFTFASQTNTILVQVHQKGDLAKVYYDINENNISVLLKKITEENFNLTQAKDILNNWIKEINSNKEINREMLRNHLTQAIKLLQDLE